MNSGVYIITNTINDKVYIGSTNDFERRWWEHRKGLCKGAHGNPHLQYSWDKYGKEAFKFGILEYLDNLEELVLAEQFWMDKYREEGKELYNFGLAADAPMRGQTHTKEARRKLSETAMGRKFSEETKRKMSKSAMGNQRTLGYKHTEGAKRKISKANRGKKLSEETRCKLSEALGGNTNSLGHKHSEETRQKMSDSCKGNQTALGCKRSEETRRKCSESAKLRWAKEREKNANVRI